MKLVIVESPGKIKSIKKKLGAEYIVRASVGHIKDLPIKELGIDINNNFKPEYVTMKGKENVIKELKKAAKRADHIYIAADPDREGEAIAWHVKEELNLKDDEYDRIEFNSITKEKIEEALKNPRKIDMNRVNAQQARRILDRLVGYKLSPVLWLYIKGKKGLSAGRVQSVTVKIIKDREEKIKNFEPKDYWQANGLFEKGINLNLYSINGKSAIKIKNEKIIEDLINDIKNNDKFKVIKSKINSKTKKPKKPFETSTLQQKASSKLGFSSSKTMSIAQKLYEGIDIKGDSSGLITYMRTDSTRVSKEGKDMAHNYILENFGEDYVKNSKSSKVKKGAQDAHEAIRPTSVLKTPKEIKKYLSSDQYKLYNLIWETFITSQLANMEYEQLELQLEKDGYIFRGLTNKVTFEGYKILDKTEDKKYLSNLPQIEEGTVLILDKLNIDKKKTKPPKSFSESGLIKILKQKGIGRPSTYSAIINNILNKKYIINEKGFFKTTDLGVEVTEFLEENFEYVLDIGFTSEMENNLDGIVKGEDWIKVLSDYYNNFGPKVEKLMKEGGKLSGQQLKTDFNCSKCNENMLLKEGKYGLYLECVDYPNCKTRRGVKKLKKENIEIENDIYLIKEHLKEKKSKKKTNIKSDIKCDKCKELYVLRKSKKTGDYFLGCSSFPECKNILFIPKGMELPKIEKGISEIKLKKVFENYNQKGGEYGLCDKCNSLFRLIDSKKGKFLGCTNYPKCKNTKNYKK